MDPNIPAPELSERDRALLTAAAEGLSAVQTASRLRLSSGYVHHLHGDIVRALGARTWTQAVALAVAAGLITVAPGGDLPAIGVACPRCGSLPGALCTSHGGTRERRYDVHQARTAVWRAEQQRQERGDDS